MYNAIFVFHLKIIVSFLWWDDWHKTKLQQRALNNSKSAIWSWLEIQKFDYQKFSMSERPNSQMSTESNYWLNELSEQTKNQFETTELKRETNKSSKDDRLLQTISRSTVNSLKFGISHILLADSFRLFGAGLL